MAESICRSLRDGALEGEHAPALTIEDSLRTPLGSHVFSHFLSTLLSNISAGKSQARCLVLVAFSRSPSFYFNLLRSKGFDSLQLDKSLRILDCYSDPLGWKDRLMRSRSAENLSVKVSDTVFKNARDVVKLLSSILDLGKGFVGQRKARFAVAIDSVSEILRHASLPPVSGLINNLRCHDQISCIFWLIHSDLHELRASAALEYVSSMVASLEPMIQFTNGQRSSENLFLLEQNSHRGKFHVRIKRRNGRVKLMNEEFHMEQGGIKFVAVSSENTLVSQNLLPKVQFNLQLSEKERVDRDKVVLPFEHQGNGETIQIYDGRRSLDDEKEDPYLTRPSALPAKTNPDTDGGKGEIHYIRDSDDELPDSDEDPDDDLEI